MALPFSLGGVLEDWWPIHDVFVVDFIVLARACVLAVHHESLDITSSCTLPTRMVIYHSYVQKDARTRRWPKRGSAEAQISQFLHAPWIGAT
eukprot:1157975-Pelagomonas_calceolata.AAC.1